VASRDLDAWTELELKEYYKLVESEDRAEGILAFNEKRKADFKGA
jgi:enoyl-CoA hydratase/carnithine racemase